MKITKEHYEHIKQAIASHLQGTDLDAYAASYESIGLSPKRMRWDCSYASISSHWYCDNIYDYADDTHLDTALRKVMGELGVPYAAN